ncbi:MAG: ribulose-phosphate 3-epimerase [Acidimicrobiia bacterium]|nr:ribulose-phosphate 3-epimerase [Acidimicrobiia bacterium]MDH3469764.1 ribulose-phosphate 3-epimerase [Acidimicrobiia bacterium]
MTTPVKIAPSLLAADFSRLAEQVATIEDHADLLHIDVMDGHFVPNLAIGIPTITSLRSVTELDFDCHLMTTNPAAHLESFKSAGATTVTMHIEAVPDPTGPEARARDLGLGFGLVLSPGTPFSAVEPFLELCEMVVVMAVEPGFGGQEFSDEALITVEQARIFLDSHGLSADIEVDGGINAESAKRARAAGANVFVAGTAVFGSADPVAAIEALRVAVS